MTAHFSERSSQQFVQLFPVGPRERKLNALAKNNAILAVEPGLQLGDTIDVDDRRSVNAYELLRIELRLQSAYRVSQQIRFFPRVKPHVVSFGFEPVYLLGFNKKNVPVHFDDQTLQMNRFGLNFFKRAENSLVQSFVAFACDMSLRAVDSLVKALLIERLQQIIQCIYFKSADGVLIIRSHEDNRGYLLWRQRLKHPEPVDSGHLDVEKHKVR